MTPQTMRRGGFGLREQESRIARLLHHGEHASELQYNAVVGVMIQVEE
jgi:hypothetical protein